jgi:hypothetical protein
MICIKTFANQFEADLAVRTLESHGLDARLSSEDVAGGIPSSFAIGGVRLIVDESIAEEAVAILTTPQHTQSRGSGERGTGSNEPDVSTIVTTPLPPSRRLLVGAVWLSGGLLLTGCTYFLAPGGWFVITSGAIVYGLYQIAGGIRDAWEITQQAEEEATDE